MRSSFGADRDARFFGLAAEQFVAFSVAAAIVKACFSLGCVVRLFTFFI